MKYIVAIILCLITSGLGQLCNITCKPASCATTNTSYCTACDQGFVMNTLGECLPIVPDTQILQILNQQTVSSSPSSSSKVVSINAVNNTFYSNNFSQLFNFTWALFPLPEAGDNVLKFTFQNIPINYQLQLRASGGMDQARSNCTWIYYQVSTTYGAYQQSFNVSQFFFTLVFNFTGGPGPADFTIKNLYSSGNGACQNMYFLQFALVAYLCNPNCTSCASYGVCTACGMSSGAQMYLQSFLGTCSTTCAISYLDMAPDFICDACDLSCARCTNPSIGSCISCNYALGYVQSYVSNTTCVSPCPPGQYNNTSLKKCMPCDTICLTCDIISLNCTSCGIQAGIQTYLQTLFSFCSPICAISYQNSPNFNCDTCDVSCSSCTSTVKGFCITCNINQGYVLSYTSNTTCLSKCSSNQYKDTILMQCRPCDTACASCTSNTSALCITCNNSLGYIKQYISNTTCVKTCLQGQYNDTILKQCRPCDPSCTTCQGISTNCTSCTFVNASTLLYLSNSACVSVCPNGTYPNSLNSSNNLCSNCNTFCSICADPSLSNCTVCNNYTNSSGTTIYYKDLNSNTCSPTCPNGQYIDSALPNICSYCNTICTVCTQATVCLACVSGYFLYSPQSVCSLTCPTGFFAQTTAVLVNGISTMKCAACNSICQTCTNSTSSDCLTCNNVTLAGITTVFFKYSGNNSCIQTCPIGTIPNSSINNCDSCQVGCVVCTLNAANCTQCSVVSGISYFLTLSSNSCVTVCPDDSFGNATNLLCYCEYFMLNGRCLAKCPSGYVGIVANVSTCVLCNQTSQSCSQQIKFNVQTTVSRNGKQFQHIIEPQMGISPLSTAQKLANGLKVYVVINSRVRLLTSVSLQIQGVSISSDGTRIIILTNYYPIVLGSSTSIMVNFRVGALLSSNGVAYNQVTGTFSLSESSFLRSYYYAFGVDNTFQTQGIVFIAVSLLFLLIALLFRSIRAVNESLHLIQLLQLIGLCRLRYLPIVLDYYNCLIGFSYYELQFLPNGFSYLFPQFYTEQSVDSVTFVYGTGNLILNFGSVFQFYFGFQIILLAFYVYHRKDENKVEYCKIMQQSLLMLWSLLLIFGSILAFMSLQLNTITNTNPQLISSIILSGIILAAYTVYFVFCVRTHLLLELYKINNLLRLVSIFLLLYSLKGAIIAFNINEVLFIIIDLFFFRAQKRNIWLYAIERGLYIIILNAVMILYSTYTLMIVVGVCLAILFSLEGYYLFLDILEYFRKKEADQLKLKESASIDMAASQKPNLQSKLMFQILNDSVNVIVDQDSQIPQPEMECKTAQIQRDIQRKQEYLKNHDSHCQLILDQKIFSQTQNTIVPNQISAQWKRRVRRQKQNFVLKVEPSKHAEIDEPEILIHQQQQKNPENGESQLRLQQIVVPYLQKILEYNGANTQLKPKIRRNKHKIILKEQQKQIEDIEIIEIADISEVNQNNGSVEHKEESQEILLENKQSVWFASNPNAQEEFN